MNSLRDQILEKTDGGRKVFTHYFGSQAGKKVFLNVYRSDAHPSCVLKKYHDRYILKDYGNNDWNGDCFFVVAKIEQLNSKTDFLTILGIINKELSLGLDVSISDSCHSKRLTDLPATNIEPTSKVTGYRYKCRNFDYQDLQWWGRYGITKETLEKYHVSSLAWCVMYYEDGHQSKLYHSEQYPIYAYLFFPKEGNRSKIGIKVYRPGAQLRFLQLGSVPRPYRFGYEQLPEHGDTLYIVGGEKDVMSMASHGLPAVCYNSETSKIALSDIKEYTTRFNRIVILYDMDETGRKCSQQLVDEFRQDHSVEHIFCGSLPLSGAKFDKDVSDYFAKGKDCCDFMNEITII